MKRYEKNLIYEEKLSIWLGYPVRIEDDLDSICQCDIDFIEILMLFENAFLINLVESDKTRQDFTTVKEFIDWVESRPKMSQSFKRFRLSTMASSLSC